MNRPLYIDGMLSRFRMHIRGQQYHSYVDFHILNFYMFSSKNSQDLFFFLKRMVISWLRGGTVVCYGAEQTK